MRHALSALCLVLAGLLAAAATAGHQLDRLLTEQQPVREIAGQLPADEAFAEAISERIAEDAAEQLPAGISGLVGSGLESVVSSAVADLLEDEEGRADWDETLQATRTGYAEQLETLFHEGATGASDELAVPLELTPAVQVLVQRIPLVDAETAEQIAPETVVEVDPYADADVDAYAAATAAQAAGRWAVVAVVAGVLAVLGLLFGAGRGRWVSLVLGGLVAGAAGLTIALTVASPEPTATAAASPAAAAVLEHVAGEFTAWARPTWWLFLVGAGAVIVLGLVGLIASRESGRRGSRRGDEDGIPEDRDPRLVAPSGV